MDVSITELFTADDAMRNIFGVDYDTLTDATRARLALDVLSVREESENDSLGDHVGFLFADDAARILRDRIGGTSALSGYARCLSVYDAAMLTAIEMPESHRPAPMA